MRNALLMITLTLGFGLAHAEAPTAANDASDTVNAGNPVALTKADQRAERNCLPHTGTRLANRDKSACLRGSPGLAYTRSDIQRTVRHAIRSAEGRVGNEGGRTCRTR